MELIRTARLSLCVITLALAGCLGGDDETDGLSLDSASSTIQPPAIGLVITTPDGRFDTLQLRWDPAVGATRYEVLAGTTSDDLQPIDSTDATTLLVRPDSPAYLRQGLLYAVRACTEAGCRVTAGPVDPDIAQAQRYIKAQVPAAGESFGASVALSADGTKLAIGVPERNGGSGAVVVMRRDGAAWAQEAELTAPDLAPTAPGSLGLALALSANGQWLVAGAPNAGGEMGAAYVFQRTSSGWVAQMLTVPAGSLTSDSRMGASVAISADAQRVAVGAFGSIQQPGAVYFFKAGPDGWTYEGALNSSLPTAGDQFGGSVALSADGETLAVGAPGTNDPAVSAGGAVFLFTNLSSALSAGTATPSSSPALARTLSLSAAPVPTGGSVSQVRVLKASSPSPGDTFGISVSLSSDGRTLAVGAPVAAVVVDGVELTGAGVAYLVDTTDTTSTPVALQPERSLSSSFLGYRVALSQDGLLLAASAPVQTLVASDGTEIRSGTVHIFQRTATSSWREALRLTPPNAHSDQGYGAAVALSDQGRVLAVGASTDRGMASGILPLKQAPMAGDGKPGNPEDRGATGAVFVY